MKGQHWFRERAAAAALLLPACAPEPGPAPGTPTAPHPLVFAASTHDLGTLVSGTTVPLEFPFMTGSVPLRIERLQPSCGCLRTRLESSGVLLPLPAELAPGSAAMIRADFATTGFHGRKEVVLTVEGTGPGLPAELRVVADLEPWCQVEPAQLDFGIVDGLAPVTREVEIRADEPFRLIEARGDPLLVEGLPSPSSERSQRLRLTLPADVADDASLAFVVARADNGYELQFPVSFSVRRLLWVKPGRRLHLGAIPGDVETQATVEIGARDGALATPQVRIEGFPGARVETVTLDEPNRYRLRLMIPAGLDPGPRKGSISLTLSHAHDGEVRTVERQLLVTALVQGPASTQPNAPPDTPR